VTQILPARPTAASGASGPPRQSRRRLPALCLAVVASVVGIGWAVVHSSALALRHVDISIKVNSTSVLSRADVLRALRAPVGRPLLFADVDRMRQRVAALPGAAAVEVERQWPRTLQVAVTARRPVAIVSGTRSAYLADRTGVLFGLPDPFGTAGRAERDLPIVRVIGLTGGLSGAVRPLAAGAVAALRSVPAPLRQRAADLRFVAGGLQFRLGSRLVRWGPGVDGATKGAEVRSVLRSGRQGSMVVDVSVPGVLVTRPVHRSGIHRRGRATGP